MLLSALPLTAAAEVLKVPFFADGIEFDAKAKTEGHNFVYEVKGVLKPQEITPTYTKNESIEELTASLVQSYVANEPANY